MVKYRASNDRGAREVLKIACGRVGLVPRDWRMKQGHKSPDYTTL
ncbi:DUF4113 domain-containing protein [Alicycliphilus denitrificans]